ncbi:MAG: hypothetical protein ACJAV6_000205 [Candidatus Paceibacteria bacterium]|jgi:hypothetical protein
MKSFLYKTVLGVAAVALGFMATDASAQFDPYYGGYGYENQYSYGQDQSALIAQIMQLIQQLQAQQQGGTSFNESPNGGQYSFYPVSGEGSTYNDGSLPRANTQTARDIQEDSAELHGEVDMNDYNNGIVFFVLTDDEDDAEDVEGDYDDYDEVDEDDDDDFQVIRVDRDLDGDDRYEEDVDDLDEDEEYFYVICVEYEDDDDDETLECGSVEDFETDDDNNNDDEPDVETNSARNIDNNSAELRGEVDMNDFENGRVFFVWGEDEDQVEDVEDEDEYNDIDEDGRDLQKSTVGSNHDNSDSFYLIVSSLDNDTDHYFVMCVEYEDDDDDDTLECGNVRDFETD